MKRQDIVDEARTWIGTPWHHLGRVKGAGCDCIGLVVGVANALGIPVEDSDRYPRHHAGNQFELEVFRQTDGVNPRMLKPGDLILMKFDKESNHIAIVTETEPYIKIIHAYAVARKVVEHSFDDTFRQKMFSCRRFKGVE